MTLHQLAKIVIEGGRRDTTKKADAGIGVATLHPGTASGVQPVK
jgi:hypothetical protein